MMVIRNRQWSWVLAGLILPAILVACANDDLAQLAPSPTAAAKAAAKKERDSAAAAANAEELSAQYGALAPEVKKLLEANCAPCHGAKDSAQGGIYDVTDFGHLIEAGLIQAGAPDASKLFRPLEGGTMPPTGALPKADVETIRKWIADLEGSNDYPEERSHIELEAVQKLAAEDLVKFDKGDRVFYRYLDLTHLYNAGIGGSILSNLARGLNKVVNSLSLKPDIKLAAAVNAEKTLFRVDLRDYGWEASAWDKLTLRYPYQIVLSGSKYLPIMQEDTGSVTPIVRAEWFMENATSAPHYYRFLGLPSDFEEFQTLLDVDFEANVEERKAMRAGYKKSAVATENRVIERHEGKFGFVWRSYEFANSLAERDIFKNPLGPFAQSGGAVTPPTTGFFPRVSPAVAQHAFVEDGGEFLYELPNGLLGYYVIGKDKNRLNQAPSTISNGATKEIVVGFTCMNCHKAGLINRADEIRDAAGQSGQLSQADLDEVRKLYVPREDFKEQVDADSASVQKALLSVKMNYDEIEPTVQASRFLAKPLDKKQVAAELWITEEKLDEILAPATGTNPPATDAVASNPLNPLNPLSPFNPLNPFNKLRRDLNVDQNTQNPAAAGQLKVLIQSLSTGAPIPRQSFEQSFEELKVKVHGS